MAYVTTEGRAATTKDIQPHPGGMGPMAGDKATTILGFKSGVTANSRILEGGTRLLRH